MAEPHHAKEPKAHAKENSRRQGPGGREARNRQDAWQRQARQGRGRRHSAKSKPLKLIILATWPPDPDDRVYLGRRAASASVRFASVLFCRYEEAEAIIYRGEACVSVKQ